MTRPVTYGPQPDRLIRWWLYAIAALVALIVLVGGATRLTDSGLSITEWNPISGVIPPLNAEDWALEFDKYRTTTEYQTVNAGMTLAQFEFIFWWEWGHRQLARLIGLAVLLPMIGFWMAGRLSSWTKPRVALLFAAICAQGAVGWWMVASGLVNRVDVAHERLAVHLTMACLVFILSLSLAHAHRRGGVAPQPQVGRWAGWFIFLVLVQIFVGGLVAGLDAGMAYNTWPLMNGALVPEGLGAITPTWRNLVDNAMTVQFIHRGLAYTLFALVFVHVWQVRRHAPDHSATAGLLALVVAGQAVMGIATLLMQVPMAAALMHQGGAVVLLAVATWHWRNMVGIRSLAAASGQGGQAPVSAEYDPA